jgi:hypothetical protein
LRDLTEKNPNLDIGVFLECAVAGLIRARLNVLGELAKKQNAETEVSNLLLLTDLSRVQGISDDLRLKLSSRMVVTERNGPLRSVSLPKNYGNEDEFFTALNNTVIKPGDVVEFITDPQECCDGLIFVHTSNGPLLLFHDEKSRKVPIAFNEVHQEISKTKFMMADMPKNGKQADHVKKLVEKAQKLQKDGKIPINESSALEALINNKYVYVYFETTPGSVSFAASDNDCVMQLGETDVKKMLSFLGCLYTFVRASCQEAQKLDKLDPIK